MQKRKKDTYSRFWENWLLSKNLLTTNGNDSTRPASMKPHKDIGDTPEVNIDILASFYIILTKIS